MKIDGGISFSMAEAATSAKLLEEAGYTGGFTSEISHDPFLPLALASDATSTLELGTSIAVAFARSPMTLANVGWDLQEHSNGRFILGLGSQIKPHITKRFSMEWSKPAARMREFIQALHAIWDCWMTGDKLEFRGEFYTHVLMTPMFTPAPIATKPKVFLASVGPLMTQVCGEVADGWFSHGFTTAEYLRDVSLPALQKGAELAGRAPSDIEVSLPLFIVAGETEAEIAERGLAVRKQIAFYGSTPAYKSVLDHHGWGDAQIDLNQMSKAGEWDAMADVVDDTMLKTFAVVGGVDTIADQIIHRFDGLIDRLTFYAPYEAPAETWAPVVDKLQSA